MSVAADGEAADGDDAGGDDSAFDAVQRIAMVDNFRQTASTDVVYSLPSSGALGSVANIVEGTTKRPAKRRRADLSAPNVGFANDMCTDDGSAPVPHESGGHMYFRVTSLRQLQQLRLAPLAPGVSSMLLADDIAITIHACLSCGDPLDTRGTGPAIYTEPLVGNAMPYSPVHLMTMSSMAIALWKEHFLRWRPGGMTLSLSFFECDEVADRSALSLLLSDLVSQGAFASAEGKLQGPSCPMQHSALMRMEEKGFAERSVAGASEAWRLTESGMINLKYAWDLGRPEKVMDARAGIPILQLTSWECMCKLQDLGWEWRQAPANRQALVFHPGKDAERIWYTSGTHAYKEYLQCLLDHERIFNAGIRSIPHGTRLEVYQALLAGRMPKARRAARPRREFIADMDDAAQVAALPQPHAARRRQTGQRRRNARSALDDIPSDANADDDDDDDDDGGGDADARQGPDGGEDAWFFDEELWGVVMGGSDHGGEAFGDAPQQGEAGPGLPARGGDPPGPPAAPLVAAAEPPLPPPASPPPPVVDPVAVDPPSLPPGPSASSSGDIGAGVQLVAVRGPAAIGPSGSGLIAQERPVEPGEVERILAGLRGHDWGIFRFTPVRKKPHGGYQVRCPFHRRNDVTDCKQEFKFPGPTDIDKRQTIIRLMYWCVEHHRFDRQRKHRRWKPTFADCPGARVSQIATQCVLVVARAGGMALGSGGWDGRRCGLWWWAVGRGRVGWNGMSCGWGGVR